MDTITSKTNVNVKFIKSLNEKKFREDNNTFYVEGIKVISEILDNKAINILFIAYCKDILENLNGGKNILDKIQKSDIKKLHLSDNIFKYVSDTVTPQGIIAVVSKKPNNIDDILKNTTSNILVLDRIQDQGNLGTIIRTCDAFNIKTIICTQGTTDAFAPKVIRSTMGSIFRVNVIYIEDINELLKIKKMDFNLVATVLNTNTYLEELDFTKKYAFILGNEANGISAEIQDISDKKIKIKMPGNSESLNVSSACSIVLYYQSLN